MSLQFFIGLFLFIGHIISWIALIHCLFRTKYPQAALGWCAAILLLPFVGAISYYLFGISRVDSRAGRLMQTVAQHRKEHLCQLQGQMRSKLCPCTFDSSDEIVKVGSKKSLLPRQGGNHIIPLFNGDQAYPIMLDAIKSAKNEVYLCTYIFGGEKYGRLFINELIAAHKRGVDVRVIVDGIGGLSSFNDYEKELKEHNVSVERFIPIQFFPPRFSLNLRNHRKLLLCDSLGFTGGMNIEDSNVLKDNPEHPIQDVHFKCQGPITIAMREAFLLDWIFFTRKLESSKPITLECCGKMDARLVMDGPGSTEEPIQNLICAMISTAKKNVTIFTPYFLPTRELISSLSSAAARGIDVNIVLPETLNHAFVASAAEHMLPPILFAGVNVYRQPAPFAHTKLLLVDDSYTFLGSTNLDPRSLSLNFELNMEVFSKDLNHDLRLYANEIINRSKLVSPNEYIYNKHSLKVFIRRLKNALAWVISPYL